MRPNVFFHVFKTPFGFFRLGATRRGLYSLDFPIQSNPRKSRLNYPSRVQGMLQEAHLRIQRYLRGERVEFRNFPVDGRGHSTFARQILENLRGIPWGRTASYESLARRVKRPKAMRAVGQVLRSNRLPVILPCHRILRKDGNLGGFSKGLVWKIRLLKLERGEVDTLRSKQGSKKSKRAGV